MNLLLNFNRGFFRHYVVDEEVRHQAETEIFKELLNNWISGERFGIETYEYVLSKPEFSFADLSKIRNLKDDEIRHWKQTQATTQEILGYIPPYLYENHQIKWKLDTDEDIIHRCIFIAAGEFYSKAFMTAVKEIIFDDNYQEIFQSMISEEQSHQTAVKNLVYQAYNHFGPAHQKSFVNSIDFYFKSSYNLHPVLVKKISEKFFGFYDSAAVKKSFINSVYNTIYYNEFMKLYGIVDVKASFIEKQETLLQ